MKCEQRRCDNCMNEVDKGYTTPYGFFCIECWNNKHVECISMGFSGARKNLNSTKNANIELNLFLKYLEDKKLDYVNLNNLTLNEFIEFAFVRGFYIRKDDFVSEATYLRAQ